MKPHLLITSVALFGLLLSGVTGCVWPVMKEQNGYRPFAMGKSDQVLWPWAPHPIHLNEGFGVASRQAVEGQIVNPGAAKNLNPVIGSADPQAIQYSLARYQSMFKTPPFSQSSNTSGGGAGSGTSGGGAKK
ncbi:MAG: hypothetical protein OEZ05_03350 [Nitrospirota bacterium]|nr:hypothetical protein [Nitrospirota bacterium]